MDNLFQSLKEKNLKLTSSRKVVFEALSKSDRALSAKELFGQIPDKTDLVSVYRNLSLFSEIGIAHKFQDRRYSLCQNHSEDCCNESSHVHVMMNCTECGLTKELHGQSKEICELASGLEKNSKSFKSFKSLILQGVCSSCS